MEIISSVNNEKVKHAASLCDKKFRKASGTFLVESYKLVSEIIGSQEIVSLFVQKGYEKKYEKLISACPNVYLLSESAFSKISDTVSSQGIIAEVKMKKEQKFEIKEPFIVLDGISDPGNMGTIIRTAIAVGYNNIVLLDSTDPHSPKVVRSSAGGIFRVNIFELSFENLMSEIYKTKTQIYIAHMQGENVFSLTKTDKLYCLVIGSEGQGVSERFKSAATKSISLPMKNQMESLNAGVSASVIMYQLKHLEGNI